MQPPDLPNHSPPGSPSSSDPEVAQAVRRCNPVPRNTSIRRSDIPSFLDSRDIVDPTTASMSWDPLTPDPSPVVEEVGYTASHYTPKYRPRSSAIPSPITEFDGSFTRHYELKHYEELALESKTYVTKSINPAIEQEFRQERDESDLRRTILKRGPSGNSSLSEATPGCPFLEQTRGRENIPVKRTKIIDRFYKRDNLEDSVISVKSEESFPRQIHFSKRNASSNDVNAQRVESYSDTTKNILPCEPTLTSTRAPIVYSKLRQSSSLQSSIEK